VNQIKSILTNKRTRYGTFSTLTAMFVIGVLVLVNVVVGQFHTKFDMTEEKLYSISDQTKNILDGLTEDITIYPLFRSGQENRVFAEILDQYAAASPHITIVPKDPYQYASFVAQYSSEDVSLPVDSVIVESGKRFRVLPASRLVTYTYDPQTFQQQLSSIDIEPRVTNAIQYVLQDDTPMAYEVMGHNEYPLSAMFVDIMEEANYTLSSLELMSINKIPEDCDLLIISTPERDYSAAEAEVVLEYLRRGGRALVMVDMLPYELPNLASVLEAYGVQMNNHMIYEADTSRIIMNDPGIFLPIMENHEVNQSILAKGYPVILGYAQGVETLAARKNSLKIEPLLSVTNQAYAKNNPNAQSVNKEADDLSGPFVVVAAITDNVFVANATTVTKLVVCGTSTLLEDVLNNYNYGTNGEFFVKALDWLTDKSDADTVYVPSKTYTATAYLAMTAQQANNTKIVAMGVIPGVTIAVGFVIWLRRRNK